MTASCLFGRVRSALPIETARHRSFSHLLSSEDAADLLPRYRSAPHIFHDLATLDDELDLLGIAEYVRTLQRIGRPCRQIRELADPDGADLVVEAEDLRVDACCGHQSQY